jgi:protease IV
VNTVPKRPSSVALILLGLCFVAIVVGIVGQITTQVTSAGTKSTAKSDTSFLSELKKASSSHLVLISLDGAIDEGPGDDVFASPTSASSVLKKLRKVEDDPSIKGVLLRINSPGGTVAMSQELYQAVLKVRKKVPIVVSMGDLAASGGYYTASGADWIVANKGTLTASIGVIMHSMNMEQLFRNKLGIQPLTIKSGKFKDILSPYRQATPADLALLQNIIDKSYNQFIGDVIYGRTLRYDKDDVKKGHVADNIRAVADGRVVLGEDALASNLVDSLGTSEDALKKLRELVGKRFNMDASDLDLDREFNEPDFWDMLFSESSSARWQAARMLFRAPESSQGAFDDIKPMTLRYANQPLWLMESMN